MRKNSYICKTHKVTKICLILITNDERNTFCP